MTTMTTRAQGLFVDEVRAAARRTAATPTVRHQRWTSLRRWFSQIAWDQVHDLREHTTRPLDHEATEHQLLAMFR